MCRLIPLTVLGSLMEAIMAGSLYLPPEVEIQDVVGDNGLAAFGPLLSEAVASAGAALAVDDSMVGIAVHDLSNTVLLALDLAGDCALLVTVVVVGWAQAHWG